MHTPPLWPCEADAVTVRAVSVPAEAAAADANDKAEPSSTAVAIVGYLRTDPPGNRLTAADVTLSMVNRMTASTLRASCGSASASCATTYTAGCCS